MIPIEQLAIQALKEYNGTNDYILYLKKQLLTSKSFTMTTNQAQYIKRNKKVAPTVVNKRVALHPYYSALYKNQFKLETLPDDLFIHKILTRKNDELHIWGSFEAVPQYYTSIYAHKSTFKKLNPLPELDFSDLSRPPKPHQEEGIKLLLQNDRFILADDMGLGKTTTAILAAIKGGFKKILVVCPASLKLNWQKEISNYDTKSNIHVVDGDDFTCKKWTIVNYDILKNFHCIPKKPSANNRLGDGNGSGNASVGGKLSGSGTDSELGNGSDVVEEPCESIIDFYKYDLVIGDEAHYLKNASSIRTELFKDLAGKIKTKWLLTGTPITNKPIDFYSLLAICESPLAQNWMHFVKRYCAGFQIKKKGQSKGFWKTSGSSNLDELRIYTADIILRRTKKELNLPPKTKKVVYLPLTTSKRYKEYMEEYEAWLEQMREEEIEPPESAHLTKLTNVRQILSKDKIPYTIERAESLIDQGHKVIIFSCYTDTIREIHEHFGKASVLVDGSVSTAKRQVAVESFQESAKISVFCGNIVAAGVGHTLTAASVVIFNDLDHVPANHMQAEDRAHRMGQENEVLIEYPLVEDTLDEKMYERLQEKIGVINTIISDAVIEDPSLLESIIKNIKK